MANYIPRGGFQVRLDPSPSYNRVNFYVVSSGGEEVATLQWEKVAEGAMAPVAFSIPFEHAQKILDDLWRSGLRPTHEEGSSKALKATERHLEDMRRIAFSYIEAEGLVDKEAPE